MRKFFIILIIAVVVLAAVFVRISISRKNKRTEEHAQVVPVEITKVTRENVKSTCELIGTISANKTAQIFPETMGRITRILVKEGSYVSKNSNIMALRNETIGFEYEEAYIRAPISGDVANILVDVGSSVTPQMPVAVVVEFTSVKINFNISENDIGCISKGREVAVEIDAMPDTVFSGKISEISPVIDPYTRTVSVKANIHNPKKLLKPGMTARVILTLGEKKDVIAIPKDALLDNFVFVVKDSTAERRDVEVGLVGIKAAEILAGLQEGENVIVVGQQRLAGGEKVSFLLRGE